MKLQKIFILLILGIIATKSYASDRSYLGAYDSLRKATATQSNLKAFTENIQTIKNWIMAPNWNARRVSQRLHIKDITKFIQAKEEEIARIQATIKKQTISPLAALKRADKIFADIILKTKDDKITAQMLIEAQKALNDFKTISAQLNEQERTQAKELLGGLDFTTYIRQMEKTYAMRLNKIPDALSEALKELEKESKTEISGKEEKESKAAKETVSATQKAARTEERILARQQRIAGSSLPSPEFQISFNDRNPSKFREFGIIGNSISPTYYGIPMLGHYADAFGYQMLTRIALIEYRYTDKTQKHENLIPAPLKKIIESSGIIPELYACIWVKPKDHTFDDYNLVYHTVLGAWTGRTYLNISPEMGIFDAQGANCKTSSPVSCESVKPTEVNWHADPASKLGAFSPNNARFILEKTPLATFWSYMAHGGRSLIAFNIIITNPDLKNKLDGIIDNNWNFDAFSLALEPIIGDGPVRTLLDLAKDSVR